MNRQLILVCAVLVALPLPTPAQQIPLEGESRIVQIHDLGDMVRTSVAAPGDLDAYVQYQLEGMAEFVRTFMPPTLDGEVDIKPLGRRYLVALARPEQQAWVEDLIRRQREAGDHQLVMEFQQFEISDAQYERVFQPLLRSLEVEPTAGHSLTFAVLSKEDADSLRADIARAEDIRAVNEPRLVSCPMVHAEMGFYRMISYVKDFEQVVTAAGETATVPVHDEVFDGIKISASWGLVAHDLVGMMLGVELSAAESPMPTRGIEIEGGLEATIDVPTVRRFTLEQKVVLPNGGTGFFAERRESGSHVVFLATVTTRN